MGECSTSSCSACGSYWRLPLMLALVLAAILLSRGMESRQSNDVRPEASADRSGGRTGETVSLTVDYGEARAGQSATVAWHEGMTVRDVLAAAVDSAGTIEFAQQGAGEAAFLTHIGGVKNEGAGGRNWTYAVNDKLGDRSYAIYRLRPGDEVLWKFAAQQ